MFAHDNHPRVVTLSGSPGHDAKSYQERHVRNALQGIADEDH